MSETVELVTTFEAYGMVWQAGSELRLIVEHEQLAGEVASPSGTVVTIPRNYYVY
jgi:hypothetical protein